MRTKEQENLQPNHPKRLHRNEVHLRGILTRDPQTRKTSSGKLVSNVTVGIKHEKGEDFFRCVFWEEHGERLSDAFRKGDFISLHGRLHNYSWEDKETRQKRYATEIVVFNFGDGSTEKNLHGVEVSDDDIPF